MEDRERCSLHKEVPQPTHTSVVGYGWVSVRIILEIYTVHRSGTMKFMSGTIFIDFKVKLILLPQPSSVQF